MESKLAFAKDLTLKAGQFLRAHLTSPLEIEEKSSPSDLVTQLDHEVQHTLISQILERYPEDHILAEENEVRHPIADGAVWVIDPIDGTTNFIVQQLDFAIMLAYFENGVGQFGIIYDVMADKLYYGGGDFPVYCNDKVLPAYTEKGMSRSLLSINAGLFERNHLGLADLARQSLGVRLFGSAAISFSRVLTGRLLGYFSLICPWDYAAASILGENLGYVTLTLDGQVPDFQTKQAVMMVPKSQKDFFLTYFKEHKEK